MSFIAQDFNSLNIISILDGRTQAIIRNHIQRYPRKVRNLVKVITMDMFSPYYQLAKQLFPIFPNTKIVLERFHIVQHLSQAMNRVRIQIMNQFDRKSHEYKTLKRYWKLIQQDSRKLNDRGFYRPMFRMHLTNKKCLEKLLSCSDELCQHYELYQLLLFHFQENSLELFFGLIKQEIAKVVNVLELPYSKVKLEATNNLIKVIKRNTFGFRSLRNFKKRILIALNNRVGINFYSLSHHRACHSAHGGSTNF